MCPITYQFIQLPLYQFGTFVSLGCVVPGGTKFIACIIKLIIYVSTAFLLIHKATCFDPLFGHLQAYIAD